jgi:hypothetical protein
MHTATLIQKSYIRRLRGKLGAYGLRLSPAAKTDRERDNHRLTQRCPVVHPSGLKRHYRGESQEQPALEERGKKWRQADAFSAPGDASATTVRLPPCDGEI